MLFRSLLLKICLYALAFVSLGMSSSVLAAVLSQSNITEDSGGLNYGQAFLLDSSLPEFDPGADMYTLDSLTLYKGVGGGGAAAVWINVFETTGDTSGLDFDSNTNGVTFVGASQASVGYAAATGSGNSTPGDALNWNFSGITLDTDTDYFLVFSTTNTLGNYIGASVGVSGGGGDPESYLNITDANSDPLFGGAPGTSGNDNLYSISVTVVPEPSSLLLVGSAFMLGVVCWKRRTC